MKDSAAQNARSNPRRSAMLAKIHCARKALGLSDDEYRATNRAITGRASAADMSDEQLGLVLDHLRAKGFRSHRRSEPDQRPGEPQERLIWALWKDLARLDALDDPGEKALRAFVKKMTGIERLEWLVATDANKVIEVLKFWRRREQEKRAASSPERL